MAAGLDPQKSRSLTDVVGHVAPAASRDQDLRAQPRGTIEGHHGQVRCLAGRRDGGHQARCTRADDGNRVFFHP